MVPVDKMALRVDQETSLGPVAGAEVVAVVAKTATPGQAVLIAKTTTCPMTHR
jgi:hypothetical protein